MHPEGVFGQGNGIRIGFFPVKYDAARKKALYYWFFACGDRNDVRPPICFVFIHINFINQDRCP